MDLNEQHCEVLLRFFMLPTEICRLFSNVHICDAGDRLVFTLTGYHRLNLTIDSPVDGTNSSCNNRLTYSDDFLRNCKSALGFSESASAYYERAARSYDNLKVGLQSSPGDSRESVVYSLSYTSSSPVGFSLDLSLICSFLSFKGELILSPGRHAHINFSMYKDAVVSFKANRLHYDSDRMLIADITCPANRCSFTTVDGDTLIPDWNCELAHKCFIASRREYPRDEWHRVLFTDSFDNGYDLLLQSIASFIVYSNKLFPERYFSVHTLPEMIKRARAYYKSNVSRGDFPGDAVQ